MSAQLTLTEDAPTILDSTAGFKHRRLSQPRWPTHATHRIDIRPEVKPDYVMDNTATTFAEAFFDFIYYDPPHIIRRSDTTENWIKRMKIKRLMSGRTSPDFFERFGYWKSRKAWLLNLKGVNIEFSRIIKNTGSLYVKLADTGDRNSVHIPELLDGMTNFYIPLPESEYHQITPSRSNKGHSTVHWLTMKPKEASQG